MNILTYLNQLRPALPMSAEGEMIPMSNGELRRLLQNKAIVINGDNDWKWDDEAPPWVWQLIFFPSSTKWKVGKDGKNKPPRRTTLVQYNFKPWSSHVTPVVQSSI